MDLKGQIAGMIMLGLVLFGVTQCTREGMKQTHIEQSDYKECLEGCGRTIWSRRYIDTSCVILCGFSVGMLNQTQLEIMVNESLKLYNKT